MKVAQLDAIVIDEHQPTDASASERKGDSRAETAASHQGDG